METTILTFGLLKYKIVTTTKLIPISLVNTEANNNTINVAWFEHVL
jgi:hypothetical protein